jgi:hypothetical protein
MPIRVRKSEARKLPMKVVEILGRSKQGMTEPYLCRCDNGDLYYLKGKNALPRGLISEWICGSLALNLALPIAEFEEIEVPIELYEMDTGIDLNDLGKGVVFGSKKHTVTELPFSYIPKIPKNIRIAIMAFDWWVLNEDRHLTEKGGNPNLFIDQQNEQLLVIDHNLAFDRNFSPSNFARSHAFAADKIDLFDDLVTKAQYSTAFNDQLANWDEIVYSVPPEWIDLNDECSGSTAYFDFDWAREQLARCNNLTFWEVQC